VVMISREEKAASRGMGHYFTSSIIGWFCRAVFVIAA